MAVLRVDGGDSDSQALFPKASMRRCLAAVVHGCSPTRPSLPSRDTASLASCECHENWGVSVALRSAVKSSGGPCCDLGAVAVPGCACKRVCVTRACGFFEAESAKAEALFELLPVVCMRSHHRCFGFQPRSETSSGSALVFVRHGTGMCSVSGIA